AVRGVCAWSKGGWISFVKMGLGDWGDWGIRDGGVSVRWFADGAVCVLPCDAVVGGGGAVRRRRGWPHAQRLRRETPSSASPAPPPGCAWGGTGLPVPEPSSCPANRGSRFRGNDPVGGG